ncbi:biopolymer transport protein [endosymbiont of Acanthamoeba sp. UWC8]|nr:protein TolQ [endosymbiont of Acanthamoeba sp. UWC8]AIF80856.1 biopolymer transport protein [endosymbiont of Acanthamoeba sp. UWC8]
MPAIFTLITAAPVDRVISSVDNVANQTVHAAPKFSFLGLFFQADFVVQTVMVLLLLASVWSWAIIFNKTISLKAIKFRMNRFENEFWSGASLDKLFRQVKNKQDHPLAIIFSAAIDEWNTRNTKNIGSDSSLRASAKERIHQAMQVAANKALDNIEKNLNFLATVGSSAPFIGLFGTVWGIMVSFQSIAVSKNTSLAVVAPGIAEALLATALGLAAAIPAVIFYNKFASEVNRISNKVDAFSMELSSMISRELDNQ